MMKIQVVVCILFLLFINGMASAGTADTVLFGISTTDEPIMLAAAAGSSFKKSISKPPSIRKKSVIRKPSIRSRTTIRKPASRIRKAKVKKASPDVVKIRKKPALPIDTTKTLTPQEEIPDGTKLDPAGEGISDNMPSDGMPEGPHGLDPAGMGKEEPTIGPGLGGGAAANPSGHGRWQDFRDFLEGLDSSTRERVMSDMFGKYHDHWPGSGMSYREYLDGLDDTYGYSPDRERGVTREQFRSMLEAQEELEGAGSAGGDDDQDDSIFGSMLRDDDDSDGDDGGGDDGGGDDGGGDDGGGDDGGGDEEGGDEGDDVGGESGQIEESEEEGDEGQPAGGSDRGTDPTRGSAEKLIDRMFGGRSPFAIDPKTGRRKPERRTPPGPQDVEMPKPPKPTEMPGVAAPDGRAASSEDEEPGEGIPGTGLGGDGTGFLSRGKSPRKKLTPQDLVAQPGGPGLGNDSEGGETLEEKRAREKGKVFKIPPQMGDPRVGK